MSGIDFMMAQRNVRKENQSQPRGDSGREALPEQNAVPAEPEPEQAPVEQAGEGKVQEGQTVSESEAAAKDFVEEPKAEPAPAPRRPAVHAKASLVQVAGFPANLMKMVRADIPSATNNQDALAAWVYLKSGRRAEVSDKIKTLAADYKGDAEESALNTILEKLTRVERMAYTSASAATDEYYMLMWLMLERMALINSPRLDTLDFMEGPFEQLRSSLRQCIQQVKNAQQLRDGRPYR